ncbi:hypothetical protein HRH59_07805 [Rheinheimera sp. YQF-2]|uniref:NTF2 fold domain-containing protein n=1 Tax=Rheinheimera lutimaris TaxID=2740584 RepID=A0A7Y5AQ48_9GAMM|nr:hypothetical protein [Rheinheimera lutimaris]NRQ42476.1 hypothetical protein [Rheinheimera lutimaris]
MKILSSIALLMLMENSTLSEIKAPVEVLSIKASHFDVIKLAGERVDEESLGISGYNITLMEDDNNWIVYYQPADYPAGQRGSIGKKTYVVELRKTDLKIVNAYYGR